MRPEEFVRRLLPEARRAVKAAGLSDAVVPAVLAQVALETGWLEHVTRDRGTGRDSRNLFNIKATTGWRGDSVEVVTTEYVDKPAKTPDGRTAIEKQRVRAVARFRAYDTYEESFADYCRLITTLPRYRKAAQATDPYTYASELQRAGYATDPAYASKLHKLIRVIAPIIQHLDAEAEGGGA